MKFQNRKALHCVLEYMFEIQFVWNVERSILEINMKKRNARKIIKHQLNNMQMHFNAQDLFNFKQYLLNVLAAVKHTLELL